jgi:hypothetical protein
MKQKLPKLGCRRWKGVEATSTWPEQQHLPCFSILNMEKERMKLNVSVVIKSKAVDID